MKTYARIQDSAVAELFATDGDISTLFNGALAWVDVSAVVPAPGQRWVRSADGSFSPPPPPPPPAYTPPTPREWLERLSGTTQNNITSAAVSNPAILLWLLKASGASAIDVTSQETVSGVQFLQTSGLLTADEANTLLTP